MVNPQFKKGVLNLCVLALVAEQDRYGYELVQAISAKVAISEGAVYPSLRRLTTEGYFTTYLMESGEGPPRKYYQITEQGRKHLVDLRREWNVFTNGVNDLIRGGDDR